MSIWSDINTNFHYVMESLVTGSNQFVEVPDAIDFKSVASSIFNGAYLTTFYGITKMEGDLTTHFFYSYSTGLQVAFEISTQDNQLSYNNAVQDIELIIRRRLTATSWQNTSIQNIELLKVDPPLFVGKTDQNFMYVNLDWNVTGEIYS